MKRVVTLLALVTLATAGESSCMGRFGRFAKAGYQKTKSAWNNKWVKASTLTAIGAIPLGIATYDDVKNYSTMKEKRHKDFQEFAKSMIEPYELNKQLTEARATHASWFWRLMSLGTSGEQLRKLEEMKKLSQDIEKKTSNTSVKWYLPKFLPAMAGGALPEENSILLPYPDASWSSQLANYITNPIYQKLCMLHEAGHLNSPTIKWVTISGQTKTLPSVVYLLSCIACPPARLLAFPVRLAMSKIAGDLAQWQWSCHEEWFADRFANRYLLDEFKAGKKENVLVLKSARDLFRQYDAVNQLLDKNSLIRWILWLQRDNRFSEMSLEDWKKAVVNAPLKDALSQGYGLLPRVCLYYAPKSIKNDVVWAIADPHHPTNERRVKEMQRYIDKCEAYARKQDLAPHVNKQQVRDLQELRETPLD